MKREVSVIVPMLNEEETITDCLESLYIQKKEPYEIIVVDNGSKDKSCALVKKLIPKFKKKKISLKLLKCPYGNQGDAREMGMRKARGEILGSLDSDSIPDENWISEIEKAFEEKDVVGVIGRAKYRNRGNILNLFYLIGSSILFRHICIGGNSAIRRSTFISVNGFVGLKELRKKTNIFHVKDDYFISKKIKKKGRIIFRPNMRVTILHRIRNNSDVGKKASFAEALNRVKHEIFDSYKILKYLREDPKTN